MQKDETFRFRLSKRSLGATPFPSRKNTCFPSHRPAAAPPFPTPKSKRNYKPRKHNTRISKAQRQAKKRSHGRFRSRPAARRQETHCRNIAFVPINAVDSADARYSNIAFVPINIDTADA